MFNLFLPFTDDRDFLALTLLFEFIEKNPDKMLYEDTKLFSVYGAFPGSIWNGGRSLANYLPRLKKEAMKERIEFINSLGVNMHFTFTNNVLKEEHLKDEYCNNALELADNGKNNCIILSTDVLKDYVKKNHPDLKIAGSITVGNSTELFKKRMAQDYDYVVAYGKRNLIDYVSALEQKEKDRVEVLYQNGCAYCPLLEKHYAHDSYNNLKQDFEHTFTCYYTNHPFETFYGTPEETLKIEEIVAAGVNKFKFNGRGENVRINLKYVINSIVKPEYREEVFETLWRKYVNSESLF